MKLPITNANIGTVAAGAGIALLAPYLVGVLAAVLKPVAKTSIKVGIMAYDKTKASVGEARESAEDWAAQAKAEFKELSEEAKAQVAEESKSATK